MVLLAAILTAGLLPGLLASSAASTPPQAKSASPVEIEIRAREIAPGEPLRIVVTPAEPLAAVEGSLFGSHVEMVRDGSRWTGWAVVDLDRKPGRYELAIKGKREDGGPVAASRQLTVIKKSFPTQKLEVEPKYVEPPKEEQERIARERKLLDAIYERRSAAPALEKAFVRPVTGEPTSSFGSRRVFNGQPRAPHSGLDLRAATGTPVKAAGTGIVAFAGDLYFSGLTVVLDHGAGLFTIYAHLSELKTSEGESVAAGEDIGLSGATGRVTGPHLHWGARVGSEIFDPRALLDAKLFDR